MLVKKFTVAAAISIACYLIYTLFSGVTVAKKIPVQLLWHGERVSCQSTFSAEEHKQSWFIEQFQVFLSNIEVTSDNVNWQRLRLVKNPYQNADTVLLGINCQERKQQINAAEWKNLLIDFNNDINLSKLTALRFTLGVPFASNHLNPISQDSPLNLPSMFWVWQTGHKFMRAEFASLNEQWLFHLGSTGCKSLSVMRGPKSPCRYPNTVNFQLPIVQAEDKSFILNVNLSQLVKNIALTSATSCQSERDSASCLQLFDNLSANEKMDDAGLFNVVQVNNLDRGLAVE